MRNFRFLFALLVLTTIFVSCTSEVTIDDPKADIEVKEDTSKTGSEGNDDVERDG